MPSYALTGLPMPSYALLGLFNHSVPICIQQLLQVVNLRLDYLPFVGVFDIHSVAAHLNYLDGAFDVVALLDCFVGAAERLVLHQFQAAGMENQRVAGNTGLWLVGFGETAVDYQELAVCLDWGLTLGGLDGHVPVDDMAVGAFNTKAVEDHIYCALVVVEGIIITFFLFVGLWVGYEIAFEGGHLVLVEQWGVGAAP